jgi:hypothetical protein
VSGSIRIKICGIVHPDDAQAAVDGGADLIGLNFVPGTPRCLDLKTAAAIAERVGGRAERVAVFKDATPKSAAGDETEGRGGSRRSAGDQAIAAPTSGGGGLSGTCCCSASDRGGGSGKPGTGPTPRS